MGSGLLEPGPVGHRSQAQRPPGRSEESNAVEARRADEQVFPHRGDQSPSRLRDLSCEQRSVGLAFLSTLATDSSGLEDETESAEFLAGQIGKQLRGFMLLTGSEEEIDMRKAPSDLGVDSLVSIEIRNWWRQMFGLEIQVLEILNAKSVRALGETAAKGLREKYLRRDG